MQLSIIVCIYNTRPEFLREALDSVYRSSLTDYEIVAVNDGSTVDYGDILQDPRVREIRTENGGILRARQFGIAAAAGKYTTFLDSDDTVSFDYHRPMLARAEERQADVVWNDWAFHTESSRYSCKNDTTVATDFDISGEDVLPFYTGQRGREHSFFVTWNKIYRTEILQAAAEEMETYPISRGKMSFGEDAVLNLLVMKRARRVSNVHTGYYFYRVHGEQTVRANGEEKLRAQILAMTEALDTMARAAKGHPCEEKVRADLAAWHALMARSHMAEAKKNCPALVPFVREKYGMEKIGKPMREDGSVYTETRLLPTNFEEIDRALAAVYSAETFPVPVSVSGRDGYVLRTLARWAAEGKTTVETSDAAVCLPRGRIGCRARLLHCAPVYRLGLLLFPKGSKIRKFLKKHL